MARFPSDQVRSRLSCELLSMDSKRISEALKGEVGLVKGKRRNKRLGTFSENNFSNVEDPGGAGDRDSGGVTTKMSWQVLKKWANGANTNEKKRESIEIRKDSERLLTGFLIKHRLHFHLPDADSSLFTQQTGTRRESGKHRTGSGGGGPKHNKDTGPSHEGSSFVGTAASGGRKSRAGTGGQHPPTSSESEFSHRETFTTSPDLTTDANTTTTDNDDGEDHHEHGIKKKLKSHSHTKTSIHFPREESPTSRNPSGIHTSRVTISENKPAAGASLSIQGFTATGKKERKATLDLSSSISHHSSIASHQLSRRSTLKRQVSVISRLSPTPSTRSTFHRVFETPPHSEKVSQPSTHPEQDRQRIQRNSLKKRKRHSKYNHDVMSSRPSVVLPGMLITSINDIRSMPTERDSEWLDSSSFENDSIDEDGQQHESELRKKRESEKSKKSEKDPSQVQIQPDLKYFMESTWALDTLNSILWLYPYQKLTKVNQSVKIKWVPKSRKYFGLCINAFFFVSFTVSALSSLLFLISAGFTETKSVTHQIAHALFSHHFPETLYIVLSSLFLSIWSVSCLLELGLHYAQFYTRFNLGVCLLKYDVTDGIHRMITLHLGTVAATMLVSTTLFFGGRNVLFVRESTGFLGYCILRPFNFAMRESIYFPLVQIFGLLVLHYFFLSVNVVLLQFAVYGKALGNMASKFNLRLAYALGELAEVSRDGKEKLVKKVIPFEKLNAEHLLIVSLFRHFSQVNSVVFGAFIFTMVCEIVLVMWLLFDIFLDTSHSNHEHLVEEGAGGTIQLPVPLRAEELFIEAITKSMTLFFVTVITFGLFGGVMHNAAEKLHTGIDCIRRHGLMLCSSSKERKFILSMMNSFTNKHAYWLGRSFNFNRPFILRLIGFTMVASMVTVTYRPDRVNLVGLEQCNQVGICLSIHLTEKDKQLYYAANEHAIPIPTRRPAILLPPRPTPRPIPKSFIEKFPSQFYIWRTPCHSFSTLPFNWDKDMAYLCPTKWSSPTHLTVPHLYKIMLYKTPRNLYVHGKISSPFRSDSSTFVSCPNATHNQYDFPYESLFGKEPAIPPVGSCVHPNLFEKETDDCGNLRFILPLTKNRLNSVFPPEKRLIPVNTLPEFKNDDARFFCCFEYALVKMKEEVRVCNMPDPETLEIRCKNTWTGTKRTRCAKMLTRQREGGRDVLGTSVPFDDFNRVRWTDCLCNGNLNICNILRC